MSPVTRGQTALGPIVAEFCLKLWNLAGQFEKPDDAALLFCARGGLRMQAAYDHFLAASGLSSAVPYRSLMVSRAAAIRPSLARSISERAPFAPAVAAAVTYEFSSVSLSEAVRSLSGISIDSTDSFWHGLTTPTQLERAFARPDALAAAGEVVEQAGLFSRHLMETLDGRTTVVLVDTGLYGTTGQLLAEGFPNLLVSTALMARRYRPLLGAPDAPALGLSVQASSYTPGRSRTTLLRYWHFVEWLFEPELETVRRFQVVDGSVRSNLEIEGWRDKVASEPGSAFAGVLEYIDALEAPAAMTVLRDADRAWREYRRAVVLPSAAEGRALTVGTRSHDFGRTETWGARPWRGAIAALRGKTMWREGEIARSGTALRVPLLVAIEIGHGARIVVRAARRALPGRAG